MFLNSPKFYGSLSRPPNERTADVGLIESFIA